ncbi:hypothetical protein DFO77_1464 [Marinilabilia salmonicolor]|uniref:Uncharacterized protein n=1 Tax=Marinilabilia salmonicolor TaxID=989 RepID=A0A368UKB7_9BACT|nr:hypothetical protein DFO77_1464 [Marinilabilia salmonicolor]
MRVTYYTIENKSFNSMKFTEEKLEQAFIELIQKQGFGYVHGADIQRSPDEVIIEADLRNFLLSK